jgi:hypothetical protein
MVPNRHGGTPLFGRFSDQPFGVKHFRTLHHRMSMLLGRSGADFTAILTRSSCRCCRCGSPSQFAAAENSVRTGDQIADTRLRFGVAQGLKVLGDHSHLFRRVAVEHLPAILSTDVHAVLLLEASLRHD